MVRAKNRADILETAHDPTVGMTLEQLGQLLEEARSRGIPGDAVPRVLVRSRGRIRQFEVSVADSRVRTGPGTGGSSL